MNIRGHADKVDVVGMDKWPSWLRKAYQYNGVAEIPGRTHSKVIQGWLKYLGAWWNDDENPWCGVFTGYCLKVCGYSVPALYMRATAWLKWGKEIPQPIPGAVAILERKGGGHVFFVIAITPEGNPVGIGGNQGNKVSIATFDKSRVLGYRVPSGWVVPHGYTLPVVTNASQLSTNEA